MPYLNVAQVESALALAAAPPNDLFTQLITLPNATWEGRTCRAIKIASGSGPGRIGVYFIGGVHAREWGNPDILIFFIQQLSQAFRTGAGITLGGKSFSAAQIQSIVNGLDLFVFPQVNPDGRNHSMTVDPCWRKNRRPGLGAGTGCAGVDINRNYDFLWNFPAFFNPAAGVANSTTTCGLCNSPGYSTYIGPSAASEPETRNVVWMADNHPHIRFFVDLHHYSELILYGWGDDEQQTTTPGMSFQNPAHNGARGIAGDAAYREHVAAPDQTSAVDLAIRMRNAIQAVRGRTYTAQSSFALYPTAGTSTDYMFSRHLVDRAKAKIHAYTIESGSAGNPTPFHPPYAEMQNIIQEVTAGLLDLCLGILAMHADVYIRDSAGDTGMVPSAGPFWESPDVVVRQADDGVIASEPARRGQTNFLYVRVKNLGPSNTREARVVARAIRFPGTEFVFPHDWTTVDATHLAPTAIVNTFNNIPVGGTRLAKFSLSAAQVDTLWGWQSGGWHPCLVAEVDATTDFGSPVGPHVWENNNLGQRNISIVPTLISRSVNFPFLIGHPMNTNERAELVLDRTGVPDEIEVVLDVARIRNPFRGVRPMQINPDQIEASVLEMHGAEFVRRRQRLQVAVRDREATVLLAKAPGMWRLLRLTFRVPRQARSGDVYRVQVAQRDRERQVVGGITLEVPVVQG